MTSPPPQPCVPPEGQLPSQTSQTITSSYVPAFQLEKRSPSPPRPALVASLEARRMSLPPSNVAAGSRISDMGPPPTTTSPASSPGSAGSSPERDASDISRMLSASGLHQFAHSEGPVSLTITISREGERSHTNISVTPSVDARKTPQLLLTALEEAKEYILGRCQDPSSTESTGRSDTSAGSSPVGTRGGSPGTKREAETDGDTPQKRSRTRTRSNGEPITAYRQSVPGIMSSQEYLQYLLRGLAAKGYSSMSPEERESLFMSTLSSNYHAFTRHISKAYHAIQQLRHKATIYLGQRDEALSRLGLLQQRLIGQQSRGRSQASIKTAKGEDVKWWPGRSLSAPSIDVATLRAATAQGKGASSVSAAMSTTPEYTRARGLSEHGRQRLRSASAMMSTVGTKGLKASPLASARGNHKTNGQPPASLTTVTLHPLSNAFSAESEPSPTEAQSNAGSSEESQLRGDGTTDWKQLQSTLAQAPASLLDPAPIVQYNSVKPDSSFQSPVSGPEMSDAESTPRATPQPILPSCAPIPTRDLSTKVGSNGAASSPHLYFDTDKELPASKDTEPAEGLLPPFATQDERGSATATLGQGEWVHHRQQQQHHQQQQQQSLATTQFLNYMGVEYPSCGDLTTQQQKTLESAAVPLDQWRHLNAGSNGAAAYSTVPMGHQTNLFREVKNTTASTVSKEDHEQTPRSSASLLPSPEILGSSDYNQWQRASLHTDTHSLCQDESLQRQGPIRPPQPQHQVQAPPPHPPPQYDNNHGAASRAAANVFPASATGQSVKLES